MHLCYVTPDNWNETQMSLSPVESHHLVRVVRAQTGDLVSVFDGKGRKVVARLTCTDPAALEVTEKPLLIERDVEISLFQSVPKGKRMDLVIEKVTELGVSAIFPMITDRVIARKKGGGEQASLERWRKLALSAAKQCHTCWLPEIWPLSDYSETMASTDSLDLFLIGSLAPDARPMRDVLKELMPDTDGRPMKIGIAIGPEGDFTEGELELAVSKGAIPVSFGSLVLRVETAAIYALSALSYELG